MKNKKVWRWMIIVVIVLVFVSPIINYGLALLDYPPIFAVPIEHYKDGGTVVYKGLWHVVIDYNELEGPDSRQDVVYISRFLKKGEPNTNHRLDF